eukprot:g20439.t2
MASRSQLYDLDAQGLANLVWSFATLASREGPTLPLTEAIARASQVSSMRGQELSAMAWAFGTWSALDAALMALVISRARDIDLSCQDVANLCLSAAGEGDGLTAMEAAALPKISRFNTQELSSIAQAMQRVTDLSPNVPGRLLLRSPEVPKEATAPADGAEVTFNIEVFDLSARTRGPAALSCQSLRAQLGSGEVRLPEELEIIIPCLKPGGVFTAFCRSFGELGALPETGLWQSLSSCASDCRSLCRSSVVPPTRSWSPVRNRRGSFTRRLQEAAPSLQLRPEVQVKLQLTCGSSGCAPCHYDTSETAPGRQVTWLLSMPPGPALDALKAAQEEEITSLESDETFGEMLPDLREAALDAIASNRKRKSSGMGKEVLMKLELLEAQDLCLATLEGHERLEYAKGRKDAGGRYFKRGWCNDKTLQVTPSVPCCLAPRRYSLTAEMLTHRDDIKDNSLWSQAQEVKSACELNAAACLLKLEKWRDVEAVCNAILRTNPANEKALFRRGKALLALGEADRAEKDLKKVLEVNAGNSEAKHLLQQARKESKGTKRERNVYAAMLQSE